MDAIIAVKKALERIKEPRFYRTERGFQGQLAAQLERLLEDSGLAGLERPIVEEEYQKTAGAHGINLRPDIIIHVPYERGVSPSRSHDNFLVVLLKLNANEQKAGDDFKDLEIVCAHLDYPLGVFVNIASSNLWLPKYKVITKGNFTLHEFSTCLHGDQLDIQHCQKDASI
jgi:hypothetical protein